MGDTVVIDGAVYTVKEVLEEHISAAVCLCAGILSLGSFLASAPCYDPGVIVVLTLCDLSVMQAAYFFLFPKG